MSLSDNNNNNNNDGDERNNSNNELLPLRIFGFGDSLTAGTSPPGYQDYPYALYLESVLKQEQQQQIRSIQVRHAGFPGWTASQLVELQSSEQGLRTFLQTIQNPSISLVILMAGTNDLGYRRSATEITEDLITLHSICYEEHVPHTLAIGIPSSGFQQMDRQAATTAQQVNENLQAFCNSEPSNKATYMDFPFDYQKGDGKWSIDGLHFSKEGYQVLGEAIAPIIKQIFSL